MSWIFTKILSACSIIVSTVTNFFTSSVLGKCGSIVKKTDVQLNEEILSLLKLYLEKTNDHEEALAQIIHVRSLDCDRIAEILNKLVNHSLAQDDKISEILKALKICTENQSVIKNNVVNSFETLSGALLEIRQTLTAIQTQISEQPITNFPHFLEPIQGTLTQLLTNQTALTNGVVDGFRLTGESLTRMESIDFTERFATIIQNQGTVQMNLKAQVISTGSELGTLITQLNVNVLSIPSESIAQATEFFTANPALANIVANALV
jgi:hypothetical protein